MWNCRTIKGVYERFLHDYSDHNNLFTIFNTAHNYLHATLIAAYPASFSKDPILGYFFNNYLTNAVLNTD